MVRRDLNPNFGGNFGGRQSFSCRRDIINVLFACLL